MDKTRVDLDNQNDAQKTKIDFSPSFETENVENKDGKKGFKLKNLTSKQKENLMTSGLVVGGLALGAGSFVLLSMGSKPESIADEVVIYPDAPMATGITNDMTFEEAFAFAREQVGPGGIFIHDGQIHHTYTLEEWNAMSLEQRVEFGQGIQSEVLVVNNEIHVHNHAANTSNKPQQDPTPDPQLSDIYGLDLDGDGIADVYVSDYDGNGIEDILLDSTGDGNLDLIIYDVDIADLENFDIENHEVGLLENPIKTNDLADVPIITYDPDINDFTPAPSDDVVDIIGYDLDNDGIADVYVFDLDENNIPDILIDSTGDGIYDLIVMNIDLDDPNLNIYANENIDVVFTPQDLIDIPVISIDSDPYITCGNSDQDLSYDPLREDQLNPNFENNSNVDDFIA
jgi:hypothetical protein